MNPTDHPGSAAGFTLLELLTVLGIIGLLSGVGIGFLSRSDNDMEIAVAVVRDKIRVAHETARSTGRTTSVEVAKRLDEDQSVIGRSLRAKVLATVGQWHLEPGERYFAGLVPRLGGLDDSDGRYGHCLKQDPMKAESLFSIPTAEHSRFALYDGFAFRVEVYLEARERCVVASLGSTFRLELDAEGRPIGSMFLASTDGPTRGPRVQIQTTDSELPLRRWVSLELEHDGLRLRLMVDGEVVGQASAKGEPFQEREGGLFEVSPGDSLVPGKVDEIQLLAYERDEPVDLPFAVEIKGLEKPVVYDRRGRLERPVTLEFTLESQVRRYRVAPGGVLQ